MLVATVISASPAPSPTPSPPAKELRRVGCGPHPAAVLVLQTTPACVVPPESIDLSAQYSNKTSVLDGGRFSNRVQYPQTLLRFGTGDPRFDVEVAPPNYERVTSANLVRSGVTDLSLAAKYSLGSSKTADYAVRFEVGVPSGTPPGFSAGNPEYTGDFDLSYALGKRFSADVTLEAASLSGYVSNTTALCYFDFKSSINLQTLLPGPSRVNFQYTYETATSPLTGGASIYSAGYHYTFGPSLVAGVRYEWAPVYPGIRRYQTLEADMGIYAIF